jgi:hypothetical protein
MEMHPDTLESVGVNELFVAVTVDVSFTTEQAVVGRIDEIHILIVVRTGPIVGYLSPSQIGGGIKDLDDKSSVWKSSCPKLSPKSNPLTP